MYADFNIKFMIYKHLALNVIQNSLGYLMCYIKSHLMNLINSDTFGYFRIYFRSIYPDWICVYMKTGCVFPLGLLPNGRNFSYYYCLLFFLAD